MSHVLCTKDIAEIEKILNEDFEKSCDWFVHNKLNIQFADDKTKWILFASNRLAQNIYKLNIGYKKITNIKYKTNIKQQALVTNLGCILDESISGELMLLKVTNRINSKLKSRYKKNKFLTPELDRMLCNTLIQPQFHYACPSWYPNLTKNKNKKDNTSYTNKCIQFFLILDKLKDISVTEFRSINWLRTKEIVHQCIKPITFKFDNNSLSITVPSLKKKPNHLNDE